MLLSKHGSVLPPDTTEEKMLMLLDGNSTEKIMALKDLSRLIEYKSFHGDPIPGYSVIDGYISKGLPPESNDPAVFLQAAQTIGTLSRLELSDLSSDFFNLQVKRGMELLGEVDSAPAKLSAAYILSRLLMEVPDEFDELMLQSNEVVPFCVNIFNLVSDSKTEIQKAGVELLEKVIIVTLRRDSHTRDSLYHSIFNSIYVGLKKGQSDGLGALQALTIVTNLQIMIGDTQFLVKTYDEALRHVEKGTNLQREAIKLFPSLAASVRSILTASDSDEQVSSGSLLQPRLRDTTSERESVGKLWSRISSCMNVIMTMLQKDKDKGDSFNALGDMALVLKHEIRPKVSDIVAELKAVYKTSEKKIRTSVLDAANRCLGELIVALKSSLTGTVKSLLEFIVKQEMRDSTFFLFQDIVDNLPDLVKTVNTQVLLWFRRILKAAQSERDELVAKGVVIDSVDVDPKVYVILRHLGSFQFGEDENAPSFWLLLAIGRDYVIPFSRSSIEELRTQACFACARLLVDETDEQKQRRRQRSLLQRYPLLSRCGVMRSIEAVSENGSARRIDISLKNKTKRKVALCRAVVFEVLSPLIRVVLSDPSQKLRLEVLKHLNHPSLNNDMCEIELLHGVTCLVLDEQLPIRQLAISILGRLIDDAPTAVVDVTRRHLLNIFSELQALIPKSTTESSSKLGITGRSLNRRNDKYFQDYLALIKHTINSSYRVVRGYLEPIYNILTAILNSPSISRNVRCTAFEVLGNLALIGGVEEVFDLDECVSFFLSVLHEQSLSSQRRRVVEAFGNIVQAAKSSKLLYETHPTLLESLCNLVLLERNNAFRVELMRTFGAIGAEDHTRIFQSTNNNLEDTMDNSNNSLVVSALDLHALKGTDHFYVASAVNTLVKVAVDPNLTKLHQYVMHAFTVITRFLGEMGKDYLGNLLRSSVKMLSCLHDPTPEKTEPYLDGISKIVLMAGKNICPYVEEIVDLITMYWSHGMSALFLLENLLLAADLCDIDSYIPLLIVKMQSSIEMELSLDSSETTLAVINVLIRANKKFIGHEPLAVQLLAYVFRYSVNPDEKKRALKCLLIMSTSNHSFLDCSVILVNRLVLMLSDPVFQEDCFLVLANLVVELNLEYSTNGYLTLVHSVVTRNNLRHHAYEQAVRALVYNYPFPNIKTLIRDYIRKDVETFALLKDNSGSMDSSLLRASVNQDSIRAAWDISSNASQQDWQDWLKRITRVLIKNAQITVVRACSKVCELHAPSARELLNVAFISCWPGLTSKCQDDLMRPFEQAMSNVSSTPREIQEVILDLAELAESIDQGNLALTPHDLANLAMENHFYAKALLYKEKELYLLLSSGILDVWPIIRAQEDELETRKLQEGEERQIENYLEVIEYYNILIPPDDPKQLTVTEDMKEENEKRKKIDFDPKAKLHKCVKELIEINHSLLLPDAASGVIRFMHSTADNIMREASMSVDFTGQQGASWKEALQRFNKVTESPDEELTNTIGRMKCYHALGEWRKLNNEIETKWNESTSPKSDAQVYVVNHLKCHSYMGMGLHDQLVDVVKTFPDNDPEGEFFKAISFVQQSKYDEGQQMIDLCREHLSSAVSLVLTKSYNRAYTHLVRLQQLSLLEEVITYQQAKEVKDVPMCSALRKVWADRIQHMFPDARVWQEMLGIQRMVLTPKENRTSLINFAAIANREGRTDLAQSILIHSVGENFLVDNFDFHSLDPQVAFACLHHKWSTGDEIIALKELQSLADLFSSSVSDEIASKWYHTIGTWSENLTRPRRQHSTISNDGANSRGQLNRSLFADIGMFYFKAASLNPKWTQAWHDYAMINFNVLGDLSPSSNSRNTVDQVTLEYAKCALSGFFKSIALEENRTFALQDSLRLLSIWFAFGHVKEVRSVVAEGRASVRIDNWVDLIPQLIARMDNNKLSILQDTQNWLIEIGKEHPHALITPLIVALKSKGTRSMIAKNVLDKLSVYHPHIVMEVTLVTDELIRVSGLWQELWHSALTNASKAYFDEDDPVTMVNILKTIHKQTATPTTPREIAFIQTLGTKIAKAKLHLDRYINSNVEFDISNAWSIYYDVFKVISKMLPKTRDLNLSSAAPSLVNRTHFNVIVFGTYDIEDVSSVPTIMKFVDKVHVMQSKQRPRRVKILDSEGKTHQYLLKGQEDPRMDERVMAFLGLVNNLLQQDFSTRTSFVGIRRYSITPISPDTGMIGWLHNCDTLFELIRTYRQANKIPLLAEQNKIKELSPDIKGTSSQEHPGYESLPLYMKTFIFLKGCGVTDGHDLAHILMSKSPDAVSWVKRRTRFMRSLAVMSVTGYVLGLGDRHLSNIMLHRWTGEIIHIDFGDCFEAAQDRENYPEFIPFRLTRVLRRAMEVGGISGTYRLTCERTMNVLRKNKDSLLAVLEAFVHDPLISWRLVQTKSKGDLHQERGGEQRQDEDEIEDLTKRFQRKKTKQKLEIVVENPSSRRESSMFGEYAANQLQVNKKALEILNRVELKLLGKDFSNRLTPSATDYDKFIERSSKRPYVEFSSCRSGIYFHFDAEYVVESEPCSVEEQVEFLIQQAMDPTNLCRSYFGWYPFW
eukprot:m.68538 g.68538  ORF g.68538 m.68538 type:complete len:2576 (-) comp8246_c0_seq1:359-8086(-)